MKLSFSNYLVLLFGAVTGLVTDLQERGDYDFVKPVTIKGLPRATQSFKCGIKTYTGGDILNAVQIAVSLQAISQTCGKGRGFPHPFPYRNSKGIPVDFGEDCPADYSRHEYPLTNGAAFNGGPDDRRAGYERVIYYYDSGAVDSVGRPAATYCGMVTHSGVTQYGGLAKC